MLPIRLLCTLADLAALVLTAPSVRLLTSSNRRFISYRVNYYILNIS